MTSYGYKLMSEEHGPRALVANTCAAEEAGFDFAAVSDHFHPWIEEQGHAPFTWSVLGAMAQVTGRIGLMTSVTCPTMRYHPAVVAQAAATVALLAGGRFVLGLGSGEALNERVVAGGWPAVDERLAMLGEAIDIIRVLWRGEEVTWRGDYLAVEQARLFDPPDAPPSIVVAAGGPDAAALAGRAGDGLMATEAKAELVEAYRAAGGQGPCYAEVAICWAADAEQARRTAHERSRWSGLGWHVLPELAQPRAFSDASRSVRPEDVAESIPCGPYVEPCVALLRRYEAAGFDRLALVQVGPDQKGFFDFWRRELGPALGRG